MLTQVENGQVIKAPSAYPLMVNDAMRTLTKPSADSALPKNNRAGKWVQSSMTPRQLASFIECGGTWRPGIHPEHLNSSKAVERFRMIALDFDGAPLPTEPAKGPQGYARYTELADSIGIAYRTLSWSKEKPYKERLVFFLDRDVTPEEYERLFAALLKFFPNADPSCGDAIRFFYGSNQPVITCNEDAVLEVDALLAKYAPQVKTTKKRSEVKKDEDSEEKKAKSKKEELSPSQLLYRDILEAKLGGDIQALFCLWPHEFREREVDTEGAAVKLEGRNPFSKTDSTGTSFVVTQMEGQLPLWHDRSKNQGSSNDFGGGHGGTIFTYWFKLHKDFKGSDKRFSQTDVMVSIYHHFGCVMPKEYLILHYLDLLRFKTPLRLRLNLLGNRIEYGGEPLSNDVLPWFAEVTGVRNERNAQLVYQCARQVAKEDSYHPFIEYIKDLSTRYIPNQKLWDNAASVFFGIAPDDEYVGLYTAYFQKFLLSTLARVHCPGVKYDVAFFLLGPQGLGKSLTMKKLVPAHWHYTNATFKQDDKDNMLAAAMAVLVGLDDIDSLGSFAETALFKAFTSASGCYVREPYAAASSYLPRSWNIYGTSNASSSTGLLRDRTGNRRINIVPVKQCLVGRRDITKEMIDDLFGQIWATAYAEFQKLPTHNIDMLADALCLDYSWWEVSARHNNNFMAQDNLAEAVELAISTRLAPDENTLTFLNLCEWISPGRSLTPKQQNEVAGHLESMGWQRKVSYPKNPVTQKKTKKTVWVREEGAKVEEQVEQLVDISQFLTVVQPAVAVEPEPEPVAQPAPVPQDLMSYFALANGMAGKVPAVDEAPSVEEPPATEEQPVERDFSHFYMESRDAEEADITGEGYDDYGYTPAPVTRNEALDSLEKLARLIEGLDKLS